MDIALFSQSLFALPCLQAIEATGRIGFPAIELACIRPHFDLEMARAEAQRVAERIRASGLTVSALSLFSNFTDAEGREGELEAAEFYIRLAPLFGTDLLKLTPGPPASDAAGDSDWDNLTRALERLAPVAEGVGARLAVETHMRQLTDTLAGTLRLLERVPTPVVGVTLDFSNLSFSDERMSEAIPALADRIYNTHVKNGTIGADGSWHFHALDTGLTDYAEVLAGLRSMGYTGYLSVECLGSDAREKPLETAGRDLEILRAALRE
jgi:sugar phosphate isomerase/epimerase